MHDRLFYLMVFGASLVTDTVDVEHKQIIDTEAVYTQKSSDVLHIAIGGKAVGRFVAVFRYFVEVAQTSSFVLWPVWLNRHPRVHTSIQPTCLGRVSPRASRSVLFFVFSSCLWSYYSTKII